MNAEKRRARLTAWLLDAASDDGARYTAQEIVDASGIYTGHARYDRCFDDLKVMERRLAVRRLPGRPAQWEAR